MDQATATANLINRFNARRQDWDRAIGKSLTVRLSKSELCRGEIVAVEPGDVQWTRSGYALPFKVTLACGVNRTLRTFQLSRIPV